MVRSVRYERHGALANLSDTWMAALWRRRGTSGRQMSLVCVCQAASAQVTALAPDHVARTTVESTSTVLSFLLPTSRALSYLFSALSLCCCVMFPSSPCLTYPLVYSPPALAISSFTSSLRQYCLDLLVYPSLGSLPLRQSIYRVLWWVCPSLTLMLSCLLCPFQWRAHWSSQVSYTSSLTSPSSILCMSTPSPLPSTFEIPSNASLLVSRAPGLDMPS